MLVNKCDNCNVEFKDGEFLEWLQITADKGIIVANSTRSVVKFHVLDFCSPTCMAEFFTTVLARMEEAKRNVGKDGADGDNTV